MARWLLMLVVVALAGFIPVTAFAQDPDLGNREREFAGAINDPLTIESNETVAMIVGIHNEATIDGTVTDVAFIIDGTLIVNGTVNGSIASFSSHVIVNAGAVVNDISLQNSTIEIAPGAQVRGQTQVHGTFFLLEWWSSPVFALVMWVLTTLFVVAGGIIFTLAAGRQFPIYVNATSRHIGQNILRMIMLWIGIPIVALLVMVTIIGIPLGLMLIGLVLPGLWWLGYSVVGARIGSVILRPFGSDYSAAKAVAATAIGMLALQLLTLAPYIGGTVIFFCGAYGSGALVYHLMRGRHERQMDPDLADFGPEFSRSATALHLYD